MVRTDEDHHDPDRLIAVVGMAGRFPGAPDIDGLWDLLMARGDAIRPVPADRWDTSAQLDPEKDIQAVGGFLEDVDRFDPTFFGISPREAEDIDPQHRLLLEESWRALEDAGRPAADLRGTRTGVYVGATWHDYEILGKERGRGAGQHTLVGNSLDMTATRVSYFLGLRGPSMAVETGCSSGLVSLHLAARALRNGEIDGALVGAVTLMLDPHPTIGLTHFGGLSPTGRCHAFSADADGFVRGEGVVMLYVKTLARALADGDRVHGVIVRTAVNNDGGGQSLVTPSPDGQEALLTEAYGEDAIPLDRLVYVEAHGTGTRRGDPIEAGAIGRVLGRRRDRARGPLGIGSVKTNIGHLEPAAGLAGLVKALLSLKHGVVPPSLHSENLNPDIPFEELGLQVVREPLALPSEGPLYMGVNSFGWGGTNAHAVLMGTPSATTEPEPADTGMDGGTDPSSPPVLLPLSAHREEALRQRALDLAELLEAGPGVTDPVAHGATDPAVPGAVAPNGPDAVDPAALAGTLARRRDHFPVRAAFVGFGAEDLARGLRSFAADPTAEIPGVVVGRARPRGRTAFVFPGQGSQWAGMGRDLWASSEVFADVVRRCAKALEPHWDADLAEIVSGRVSSDEWLSRIDLVQPVLWAVSLGLAELWREAGVVPDVVVGHSQGEVTAATLAGILSYEDAALVMARRSAIAARRAAGNGRMLAVDLDVVAAERALAGFEESVSLAVDNGPNSCVLSGDTDAVLELRDKLEADGVFCRLVKVDYASHSHQMDALREDLLDALRPVSPRVGDIPLMSTVRVSPLKGPEMDAAYWTANLRQPVFFADTMSALFDEGVTHVVEISPHPVLVPAIEQLAASHADPPVVVGTLRRDAGAPADLARAFARGYTQGLAPFAAGPGRTPASVPVPGYPWQRDRHWIGSRARRAGSHGALSFALTPSAGERDAWQGTLELSLDDHPWLRDHQVYEAVVLPGAAMMAFALHAARARLGEMPGTLTGLAFHDHLTLTEDHSARISLLWRDDVPGGGGVSLLSLAPGATSWTGHATARAARRRTAEEARPFPERLAAVEPGGPEDFYAACSSRGLRYGPSFQGVRALHVDGSAALGRLELPARCHAGSRSYALHPALWDAALQVSLALGEGEQPVVPVAVERVCFHADFTDPVLELWSYAVRGDTGRLDLTLYDADRRPLLTMEGLVLQPLAPAGTAAPGTERELRLRFREARRPEAEQPTEGSVAGSWAVCGGVGTGEAARRMGAALSDDDATVDVAVISLDDGDEAALAGRLRGSGVPDALAFLVPPAAAGLAEQRRSLVTLTTLVRAVLSLGEAPRLAVVTSGAQAVTPADHPDPGGALFWGYTRALRREHPELRPLLLDAGADPEAADWARETVSELLSGDDEDQVALRGGRRYVARLVRGPEGALDPVDLVDPVDPVESADLAAEPWQGPPQPFRLAPGRRHAGDGPRYLPLERRAPGPGEVEVEVMAAALHSTEVPTAPGSRPGAARTEASGFGCAGRIAAVGEGVTGVRPGDRVVACASGPLGTYVTVREDHTKPVPAELADQDAAALVLVTATAWYGLVELARLTDGETVLVHSAPDGLDLAAVRIARRLGATPIATAGSEAKRAQLRALGVEQVFDSSDPSWAEEAMTATDGRGVDVVLNSLPGPAVPLGLSVLAADGRFVEAGEQALREGRTVGLDVFRKGISLAAVDVPGLMVRRPERFARLLAAAWESVGAEAEAEAGAGAGEPVPRPAVTTYAFREAAEALRDLAVSDHTAMFALVEPETVDGVAPEPMPGGRFRANGTYVISGGLGALGLSLAEFLAAGGAGALVLLGRSEPGEEALARVERVRALGTRVHVARVDVADADAVARALDRARAELPPLRGVFHAAGLLDDATVLSLRPEQVERVLAPKIDGALCLDRATEGDPLDLFVLFSSAAALVGNAGQAAYAAANAFLDTFAEARRRRGRPALSVQWGPFEDIGLATADAGRGARLAERGMGGFTADEAWQALERFLDRDDEQVTGYVPLDLPRWFAAYPDSAELRSWELLRQAAQEGGSAQAGGGGFLTRFEAAPQRERVGLVEARVRQLAGAVLQLDAGAMDAEAPFKALGLDSLMSLELRNRLEADLGLKLSPTLLWTHGTARALAGALTERLGERLTETAAVTGARAEQP
ncbi:type I polyketide synthase [Streptomyces sp. JV178]|uniref:type I polyketide synthase n=1 Tax=Streptomyces sp. JV178 TaxID=858632 RepID=UPI0015D53C26|nr:type I polyketide synthase [Streptomyces sp. JV178]